jgi:Flp pilus assembly protein TadD
MLRCTFSDEQGKVLRNVETRLTPAGTEEHQFQKSNKSGEVVFHDLKQGSYELMAQLKGFVTVKREVEMTGDQTVDQALMTEKAFDQFDNEARDAIKNEQFSKALPALQKLVSNYPEDAAVHFNLGLAYAGLQQEEKALAEAGKAAQLDPQFANSNNQVKGMLLRERGQNALKSQDFTAAADAFEKWMRLDPKNDRAYYGLALAYGHQGKFAQALAAVDKALELSPQNDSYLAVKQILETNAGKK